MRPAYPPMGFHTDNIIPLFMSCGILMFKLWGSHRRNRRNKGFYRRSHRRVYRRDISGNIDCGRSWRVIFRSVGCLLLRSPYGLPVHRRGGKAVFFRALGSFCIEFFPPLNRRAVQSQLVAGSEAPSQMAAGGL